MELFGLTGRFFSVEGVKGRCRTDAESFAPSGRAITRKELYNGNLQTTAASAESMWRLSENKAV